MTRLLRYFFSLSLLATAPAFFVGCVGNQSSIISLDGSYGYSYAVVVSKNTYAQLDWKDVADALVAKRAATLIIYDGAVSECRIPLANKMPRYTAFVARPEECGRDYVAEIHRLTRRLDDDPWLDTQWGIITGADAQSALRVAEASKTLIVKRALTTTGLREELYQEYFVLNDTNPPGNWLWKKSDGTVVKGKEQPGKNDAFLWTEQFESSVPDLLVTSAHGFENGVEMPFSRGILRVVDGKLYPVADVRQKQPDPTTQPIAESHNDKVYFPVGNCLVGHVNDKHCMVTTMMGAYGVNQMAGYTVDTWFGRGGWDMLALWQSVPGRYSFSDSFFLTQQAMLHDIAAIDPKALDYKIKLGEGKVELKEHTEAMSAAGLKFDPRNINSRSRTNPDAQLAGLLWDIDTVAFYGDPAWKAVSESGKLDNFFTAGLFSEDNKHRFVIKILDAPAAIQNSTPIGIMFSTRLRNVKLTSGAEYKPIIADNFILVLNPRPKPGDKDVVVTFEGDRVED